MRTIRRRRELAKKINFILNHLEKKDRDEFLDDLVAAVTIDNRINHVVESWLETAEINANPQRKQKISDRVAKLQLLLSHEMNG